MTRGIRGQAAQDAPLGRSFWTLWAASALSNLGDGVFRVALPLLAVRLTPSPGLVAGVTFAARLPWVLFALHAGALSDRLDRRRTMRAVNLLRVGVIGGLAAIVALDAADLPLLYAVAFVLGIGETLFDTSSQSILPALVSREQLSRANGRLYAAELSMNELVGQPLGGLLAGVAFVLAFSGSALVYLIAAGALTLLAGSFRPVDGPGKLRVEIAEGLRFVWRHRLLRTLGLVLGGLSFGYGAGIAVLPLYAVAPGPMGLSELGFGLLLAAGAVGGVAGSFLVRPAERFLGRSYVLALSILVGSAWFVTAALTANAWAVGAAALVTGVASVIWNVVTLSFRQSLTPDHLLGRANAVYRLLGWGTLPLGAAAGGLLGEVAGLRMVFAAAAVINVALLVPTMRTLTKEAIAAAETAPGTTTVHGSGEKLERSTE